MRLAVGCGLLTNVLEDRIPTRVPVLDGWRGISILCVLAGHMLPLGPKFLRFNEMIATTGMSLFFVLSGFLIVSMLSRDDNVLSFLIRRVFRIVPLAWGFLIIVLLFNGANWELWQANLLFYENLPPFYLLDHAGHFWSLCVEMQFYVAIALCRRARWPLGTDIGAHLLFGCDCSAYRLRRKYLYRDVVAHRRNTGWRMHCARLRVVSGCKGSSQPAGLNAVLACAASVSVVPPSVGPIELCPSLFRCAIDWIDDTAITGCTTAAPMWTRIGVSC